MRLFLAILLSLSFQSCSTTPNNLQPSSSDTHTKVYFSPSGGCQAKTIELITQSKKFIDIAMYSLNNTSILEALNKAKNSGIKVRVLVDRTQGMGVNKNVTLKLKQEGYDIRIHSVNNIQHNKFAIFDGKKVVTGSFNWTNNGEKTNEENCIILDDEAVVKAYENRFNDHLWMVNTEDKSQKAFEKLEAKVKEKH